MSAQKLKIDGLSKQYGSFVALAPIDLTVEAGEFVTLLGPSGSGKTTLLMAIAGLVLADSGVIWIDGRDSTQTPVYDRDVGMVFQNYALFPHLDVFENVAFPLRMRGLGQAEIDRRTKSALSLVQLDHLSARLPKELSGGQQQRVAIARSVIYEPSIILMDEPLGALDKRLREQMQFEIRRIHRELGVTILYVTHDQEEALAMSDRVCLMNGGRIEQLGTAEQLYFQPSSHFTANFLGEANIIAGQQKYSGSDIIQVMGGVEIRVCTPPPRDSLSVSVLIRPESFMIGEGGAGLNRIEAKIVDVIMLGPLTRVDLVSVDGTAIIAKLPTRRVLQSLQAGDHIGLTFAVEDTIVLPPS